MADQNPFAGLAPLDPSQLYAQRSAKNAAETEGLGYWVRQAGQAGVDLHRDLVEAGRSLNPEDRRALTYQAVMGQAQKSLAEMVKSGDLEPSDAQEIAISQAMQSFMAAGDYQAAQSLLPALNQVRTYKAELEGLKAGTFKDVAAGQKDINAIGIANAKLPGELEKEAADAAKARSDATRAPFQNARDAAEARRADRWVPSASGDGSGYHSNKSTIDQYTSQAAGAARAIDRLGQLTELVLGNPGVSSSAASGIAAIKDSLAGAGALLRETGDPFIDGLNKQKEKAADPALSKLYAQKRGDLNVNVGEFKSLVMDLAYSLARARDPSGRLSDADVENAKQIIGAAGDPKRMTTVMARLAKNTYDDLMAQRSRGKDFQEQEVNDTLDRSYAGFNQLLDRWRPAPGPGRGPSGAADKDGWVTLPNGVRVREKKQ